MSVARDRARYIGRRVAQAVPTLLLIVSLNFLLVHLAPGNAADRSQVATMTANFKNGYHLKRVFAEAAAYCMGD